MREKAFKEWDKSNIFGGEYDNADEVKTAFEAGYDAKKEEIAAALDAVEAGYYDQSGMLVIAAIRERLSGGKG